MAKYEVKMSCGHTETIQLFGKMTDRDRKIAWLEENGICQACRKADRDAEYAAATAAAAEKATEENLPALTGTEKQINWALTIRANKLAELDKMLADINAKIADQAQRDKNQMTCQAARNVLITKTESRFWIDNRDVAGKRLLAANNLQDEFKAEFARLTAAQNNAPAEVAEVDAEEYAISDEALQVAIDAELANAAAEINTNTVEEENKMSDNKSITMSDYNTLQDLAEKIANGQYDAAIQIKTNLKSWLGYNADPDEIICHIESDGLNGFRGFLSCYPIFVRDEKTDCVYKLFVQLDGDHEQIDLKKISNRDKYLAVNTRFDFRLDTSTGKKLWYLNNFKSSKKQVSEMLAYYAFGLTIEEFLQERKSWLAERLAAGADQMAIDDQTNYISDKHSREVKPCDDNDAVFDLLPDLDDLNDDEEFDAPQSITSKIDEIKNDPTVNNPEEKINALIARLNTTIFIPTAASEPENHADCKTYTLPLAVNLIFIGNDGYNYAFNRDSTLTISVIDSTLKFNNKKVAAFDSAALTCAAAERLVSFINYLNDYDEKMVKIFRDAGFGGFDPYEIAYAELLEAVSKNTSNQNNDDPDGDKNNDDPDGDNPPAPIAPPPAPEENPAPVDARVVKMAQLKAAFDAATVKVDKANQKLFKAREVVRAREKKAFAAEDARFKAKCAYHDYLREVAEDLTAKLLTPEIHDAKLFIICQNGQRLDHAKSLFALRVNDGYKSAFEISMGFLKFGGYDTSAQIEKVFALLNDAIARGDNEFKFPTIAELDAPPPKKNSISDSLARAMKIALEECQKYCREHNLPAAQNELNLFEICSNALETHHAQATLQANCDSVNETAPEGWQVSLCTDKPDQYQITYNGDNVTTLDSLVLAKILPPDKFFAQFAPITDKNFSPQNQFLDDRRRELDDLLQMRQELPADSPKLKTIDDMIDQLKRDIFQAEINLNPPLNLTE